MHHLRVLEVGGGVLAFYDGRVPGYRFAETSNWVDDGALSLGIASYAVLAADEALVYDTHVSVEHARFIRRELERRGVKRFTVVLSHWHLDHVAGNAVFADSEIIASQRTLELLSEHKALIEAGELEGPPPIDPLVLPTSVFGEQMTMALGGMDAQLIHTNIHSDDATVLWLADSGTLLCGDTMEDTVTFVDEPDGFDLHLANLERLADLGPQRILPNHGDSDVIAAGGYPSGLIRATQQYILALGRLPDRAEAQPAGLRELLAEPLEAGWIHFYAPYEAVHRHNIEVVLAARTRGDD